MANAPGQGNDPFASDSKLQSSFENETVITGGPGGPGGSGSVDWSGPGATAAKSAPGTEKLPTIPDVTLEKLLGRGGMGAVFRGRQITLDRSVAVKVINPGLAKDESFVKRFEREAKVLAKLSHPNIVACYQAGKAETGEHYLLMEFVEGHDLRHQVQKSGPLSERDALVIARQVADALAHANDAGIIHRDVKPENILLKAVPQKNSATSIGAQAKLVDLGLASLARPDAEAARITQAGTAVGTPLTMAPEQADAPDTIDHRADIYALGCTTYFALTGKFPHEGGTVAQVIAKKLRDETPSPARYRENLSQSVVDLVLKMIALHVDERPATYEDLLARLDAAIAGQPQPIDPRAETTAMPKASLSGAGKSAAAAKSAVATTAPAGSITLQAQGGPPKVLLAIVGVVVLALGAGSLLLAGLRPVAVQDPGVSPTGVRIVPTPPAASPGASPAAPAEPRDVIWEQKPKFFSDPKNLLEGWKGEPEKAWGPLDDEATVSADLQAKVQGDLSDATLWLANVPTGAWCLSGELTPQGTSEVGIVLEAGGVAARFVVQTFDKSVVLTMKRGDERADSLGLTTDKRPLELRCEWIDGTLWGQVVGYSGKDKKGAPKPWAQMTLPAPPARVGLFAKKLPKDIQGVAFFGSMKLQPEKK